jgi:hypothetical protein
MVQSIADHEFELFPEVRDKKGYLKVHLDRDALASVLRGDVVATALFGGSLAIHERDPDIFHPSTQFALNWLRA